MSLILLILLISLMFDRRQTRRRQRRRAFNALVAIEMELYRNLQQIPLQNGQAETLNYRTATSGGALSEVPLNVIALIIAAYDRAEREAVESKAALEAALMAIDRHMRLYGGRSAKP
tara:strand:+ start:21148 stop:21498 length:351 start_codon:yes stop_codon:yes gene_type:complete